MTSLTRKPLIIIMAGGTGKRFWPASRQANPKQALTLFSKESLLQETLKRVQTLTDPEKILINTSVAMRPLLEKVCGPVSWIEEPWGMDTAACVGLSAAWVEYHYPGSVLALLPADHYIPDTDEFQRVLVQAMEQAQTGDIVLIGIKPTRPDPGYGYIELAEPLGEELYRVAAFCEKPSLKRAEDYLRGGQHLWNAGMFVAKASVLLEAFHTHQPLLGKALERMVEGKLTAEALEAEYRNLTKISFDHAIMEKVSSIKVIRASFVWDDVGSWLSMERIFGADENGNVVRGQHVGFDTKNCTIVADASGMVATAGLQNLVIVQSGDAVLVIHKDSLGQLKNLVESMEKLHMDPWL